MNLSYLVPPRSFSNSTFSLPSFFLPPFLPLSPFPSLPHCISRMMRESPSVRVSIVWKYAADQRRYTRRSLTLSSSGERCSIFARSFLPFFVCVPPPPPPLEPWIVSVTRAHASSCTQFVPFDRGGTPRSTALELFLLLSFFFFFFSPPFFSPPDILFSSLRCRFLSAADESRWNRRRNTNTRRNFFPGCFILRATGRGRGWGVSIG